jgi:hypothetical protein
MKEQILNAAYDQVLWFILIPSAVIYTALIFLTFLSMDSDIDSDFDSDGEFGSLDMILSFRNAIYFMFGYSGGTLIAIQNGLSTMASTIIGLSVGILLVAITVGLMFLMYKLREENRPSYDGLVGKTAKTYLRIESGNGGKITLRHNGSQREMNATSDVNIPTGALVTIESVDNGIAHVIKQTN